MIYRNQASALSDSGMSFAGCGFLGSYHVGAISCFELHAPHMLTNTMSGSSSGALVACAVINGFTAEQCARFVLDLVLEANACLLGPLSPNFQFDRILRDFLERMLPCDAHVRSSGRLFVSMTRFPDLRDVVVSEFNTREELIQVLMCSCFIPFYSGIGLPKFKGSYYFDGAFSNNLPSRDERTIKISPFAGESGICPDDGSKRGFVMIGRMSTQASLENAFRMTNILFPQDLDESHRLCNAGFSDTLAFLGKKGYLESCPFDLGYGLLDCPYDRESHPDEILPPSVAEVFTQAINRQGKGCSIGSKLLTRVVGPVVYPGSCVYSVCKRISSWMSKAAEEKVKEKVKKGSNEKERVEEERKNSSAFLKSMSENTRRERSVSLSSVKMIVAISTLMLLIMTLVTAVYSC